MSARDVQTLQEILTSVRDSLALLRPAIRSRHYVAGTCLYDDILKAEAAMQTLKENVEKELHKHTVG